MNQCNFHGDPIAGYNIDEVDKVRPICSRCIPSLHKGYYGEQRFLTLEAAQELLEQLRSGGLLSYKEEVMKEFRTHIEQTIKVLEQLENQISAVLDLIIQSDTLQEQLYTYDQQLIADILHNNCQYSNIEQKYKIKQTNIMYSQINHICKQTITEINHFQEKMAAQLQQLTQQEINKTQELQPTEGNQHCKELFKLEGLRSKIRSLTFYPKFNWLISSCEDIKIFIWEMKEKKVVHTLSGHTDTVNNVLIVNDVLISNGYDRKLIFWRYEQPSWNIKQTVELKYMTISMIKYKNYFASINDDKTLRFWEDTKCIKELKNKVEITSFDCNSDYSQIAIGQVDGIIRVRKEQFNLKIEAHSDCIKALKFHLQNLVSGGWDKQIKIWIELRNGDYSLVQTLYDHSTYINFIGIIGNSIISTDDKVLKIWGKKKVWEQTNQIGRFPQVTSIETYNQVVFLGLNNSQIQVLQIK